MYLHEGNTYHTQSNNHHLFPLLRYPIRRLFVCTLGLFTDGHAGRRRCPGHLGDRVSAMLLHQHWTTFISGEKRTPQREQRERKAARHYLPLNKHCLPRIIVHKATLHSIGCSGLSCTALSVKNSVQRVLPSPDESGVTICNAVSSEAYPERQTYIRTVSELR